MKTKSKMPKLIGIVRHRRGVDTLKVATLEEHIKNFAYTLECGKSYENEKGNKKINLQPKSAKALVTQLNNAINNSAANGYAGYSYSLSDLEQFQLFSEYRQHNNAE